MNRYLKGLGNETGPLTADIYKNKNTGDLLLVNKTTGEIFRKTSTPALGSIDPVIDYPDDWYNPDNTSDTSTEETTSGESWWQKTSGTVLNILNDPLFQKIGSNLNFSWWDSDGDTINTPNTGIDPTTGGQVIITESGGGIDKNILILGGMGLLLIGAIIAFK